MIERLKFLIEATEKKIESALNKDKLDDAAQTYIEKHINRIKTYEQYLQCIVSAESVDSQSSEHADIYPHHREIFHRIEDELIDAEEYLYFAVNEKSREYLSMSKDEARHAHVQLAILARELHKLSDAEVALYNELMGKYNEIVGTIKSTVL